MAHEGPKILIYDIETSLSMAYLFSMGKQVIRHGSLLKGYFSRTHIISIQYRWVHEKKTKLLTWGESIADEKKMIEDFDKLISQADCVIGKNSARFDDKHINSQRLWHDLPGNPDWMKFTDDIERQMRRFFNLQSYSLDYFSEQLGLGGKTKMDFSDWVHIGEYRTLQLLGVKSAKLVAIDNMCQIMFGKNVKDITRDGKVALKKMFAYGIKDTDDTTELFKLCSKHFKLKFNHAVYHQDDRICPSCGADALIKHAIRVSGKTRYQRYRCTKCGTTCQRPLSKTGKEGKIS